MNASDPSNPKLSARPAPPPSDAASGASDELLHRLGVESDAERTVRRVLPWVVSLGVHALLVLLGFVVTWTVIHLQEDEEPLEIVADFDSLAYEPVQRMAAAPDTLQREAAQDRLPVADPAEALEIPADAPSPLELLSTASRAEALSRLAPTPSRSTATFVGLTSSNARRIAYVIDGSGSMVRSLSIVLDELERSLAGLVSEQFFAVVFFQGNRAVIVPPANRMHPATGAEKARVRSWIDANMIPEGKSNPLAALERAIALEPDVIFLLSENITGSGEFEIDQGELLALLEELNPRDPASGRRAVQINCVQFLDEDPLGTLRLIAERHGGKNGYKFLDRGELGMERP